MPPTRAEIAARPGLQHRELRRGSSAGARSQGRARAHPRRVARIAPEGHAGACPAPGCRSWVASPPAARSSPPSTSRRTVRSIPTLFAPRADYLLRVRGTSMRDAGILDGDLLAVHRTAEARSGQIVVARISGQGGDEVTVKRLKRRGARGRARRRKSRRSRRSSSIRRSTRSRSKGRRRPGPRRQELVAPPGSHGRQSEEERFRCTRSMARKARARRRPKLR